MRKEEKEIIKNNKNVNIYKRIIFGLISAIFLLSIMIIVALVVKKDNDIFPKKLTVSSTGYNDGEDDEQTQGMYGIIIEVSSNLYLHPNYKTWVKENNLKEKKPAIDDYGIDSEYYLKLTESLYNSLKGNFEGLDYKILGNSSGAGGFIFDLYYSLIMNPNETIKESTEKMEKIRNDFFNSGYYKNLLRLLNEDYIEGIRIDMYYPTNEDNTWRFYYY